MADGILRLSFKIPLLSNSAPETWVHLAYEGEWNGHPSGDFRFDSSAFANMIRLFNAQKNPIPLTYEHPVKDSGQPVPAAGWIKRLELRGSDLWGLVSFTPRGAEMVRAGEYRFCSVVVDMNAVDRVSGESVGPELYEVGLTNTPFLDGQHPITLTRKRAPEAVAKSTSVVLTYPEQIVTGIGRRR